MKRSLLVLAPALIALAGIASAQTKVSKKEYQAYMDVQNATTPDARIAAADKFVESFADSKLKSQVLFMAADAAERKNDSATAITYAQNALDADPKNFEAMLLISGELARITREHDLDRDDKLAKATKYANDAIAAVNEAPKPNNNITDDQWAAYKKDKVAEAHRDIAMCFADQKKYDDAIKEFKTSIDAGATPDPTTMIRLAAAYDGAGKPDDAIAELDKVLAMPNLPPALKPFAQHEKTVAEGLKNKK
jgi:tetratricopeptide (TPR) repeat protein